MFRDYGNLIYEAESQHPFRGKDGIKIQIMILVVYFMGILVLIYRTLSNPNSLKISISNFDDALNTILTYFVIPFIIFFYFITVVVLIPFSVDRIYSKGIKTFGESYDEIFSKKTFRYYNKIYKMEIEETIKEDKKIKIIKIYDKEHKKPLRLESSDYINNFMEEVEKALKEKCPNADWKEIEHEQNLKSE